MTTDRNGNQYGQRQSWYRRPRALRPGDTIGIVSPASAVNRQRLEIGIEELKRRGFNVKVGHHVFGRSSLFAGTDRERAEDLSRMLEDPDVHAIFCARGGYGSQRLLPLLSSLADRTPPKIFAGYSDITALHSMFLRSGWVTWHSPMPGDWMNMDDHGFSLDAMMGLLTGRITTEIPLPSGVRPISLRPGQARGRLVGGNLALLAALLGTEYEVDTKDAILFIEDVGEAPYRIDRMLSSMQLAGKLSEVNGVVLGDFTNCEPQPGGPLVSVEEVLRSHFGEMNVPVIMGYPSGHGPINVPLPLGLEVVIDADQGKINLSAPPVEA